MALRNDPRLYSGGSVVVDSRPHVQLYAQLQARNQAKEEAFDEYVRGLNKNINPAGLRNVDQPILQEKIKEWQTYGVQNRDALRNPNKDRGQASMEFQARYQDIRNLIEESKQEEEKKKPLVNVLLDPEKRKRLGEEVFTEISSHDEPLYVRDQSGQLVRNPNRRSFDVSKISFEELPFDVSTFPKEFADIKKTALPPVITKDPKTMTQTVTTDYVFTPKDKDIIAERSVSKYMNDPSFKKEIDRLNPEDYRDFYRQNFGAELENEGDLAAAYALRLLQQETKETKLEADTFERQKSMAYLNDKLARDRMQAQDDLIKARIDYKRQGDNKGQEDVLNRYISQQYKNGITPLNEKGLQEIGVNIDGKSYNGKFINVPNTIANKYQTKVEIDGVSTTKKPDMWLLTDDKKYIIPLFTTGEKTKKGRNTIFHSGVSKPIDMLTYKTELRPLLMSVSNAPGEVLSEFEEEEVPPASETGPTETIEGKDIPKGANVTQGPDGNYYYNGKRIIM